MSGRTALCSTKCDSSPEPGPRAGDTGVAACAARGGDAHVVAGGSLSSARADTSVSSHGRRMVASVRSAAAPWPHTSSVMYSSSGELGRDSGGEGCDEDDAVEAGDSDAGESGNGAAAEGVRVGDCGWMLLHGPQNTAVPHASHAMGHRQLSESALQRTICHRGRGNTPFRGGLRVKARVSRGR